MPLKVIGAGFGRTGTKSLQLALEILGIGKCYHMEELFRNPSDVKHWQNAYDENNPDWNSLFENYNSAVDFPTALYYKELAYNFPEAKVILTTRDAEKWYNSAYNTIYKFDPGPLLKIKMLVLMVFSSTARNFFKVIMLNNKSLWDKKFDGKFEDKEYTIKKYNKHVEEVTTNISSDRLLLFHPKDGWAPLCEFLNLDIPDQPFPNTNQRQDFHKWAKDLVRDVLN